MKARIRELDGIRGIAVLMVIIWHYFTCEADLSQAGPLISYSFLAASQFWSGVDLFFVLSGFLIGGIILDFHKEKNFLKVFWIKRSCRILPVLVLLLITCWVLQAVLDTNRFQWLFKDLMPWWSYASFTQNIQMGVNNASGGHFLGITWSLAVEEQFYLLAPAVILLLGRRIWVKSLVPLILLAFALRVLYPGLHAYVNMAFRMDTLLMGVVVALLIRDKSLWSLLESRREFLAFLFGGMILVTGVLVFKNGFGNFKFTWFAVFYSVFLLVSLLYQGSRWTVFLRSPLLCFWGSISYGLYMFHQAISGMLHGWLRLGATPKLVDSSAVLVTLLAFVLSVLVAWISYRTFEAYFLKLGSGYKYGESNSAASVDVKVKPLKAC